MIVSISYAVAKPILAAWRVIRDSVHSVCVDVQACNAYLSLNGFSLNGFAALGDGAQTIQKISTGGANTNMSEVLIRDIETADTGTPLRELARRMRERGIGFMPILEGDKLVGVITDRDIAMRAVSESKDPEKTVASDVMSLEVVCCFEDDSTEQARELMAEHGLSVRPETVRVI